MPYYFLFRFQTNYTAADTLGSQVRSQIQQLSSIQLEELAEALLDFSTTADLVTWLQTHQ